MSPKEFKKSTLPIRITNGLVAVSGTVLMIITPVPLAQFLTGEKWALNYYDLVFEEEFGVSDSQGIIIIATIIAWLLLMMLLANMAQKFLSPKCQSCNRTFSDPRLVKYVLDSEFCHPSCGERIITRPNSKAE